MINIFDDMISVLTGCVDVIILWLPGCLSLGLFTISRVEIAPAGTRSSAVTCNMKYAGPAQPEPPTWPLTTKWCLENFTRYLTLTSLTLAGKRCSGQFYLPSFLNVKCQRNSHIICIVFGSVLKRIMKMGRIRITNNIRKSKLDEYE